ncbi:hypothetical protein FXO38_21092 [Capsicum annuum]|nr:hypothetical protein FXO37_31865 [Capsicum annuum]KAF3642455.1 hypothetical protein FXO38_21092 [Capsicum annuum]
MLCGDFVGISDECKTKLDLKRLESQLMEVIDDFLLVFLDVDVSNNVNNGNWLNEVMEKGCSYSSYKMKMLPPQGWYEQGIFSTFLSGNKIPSWFTKLVVRSILKENLFEDYYVQTVGSEGGVEEEDNNDNIRDYDDDDNEEATLAEIEELFGDLGERNETMLQQCVNIDEL